MNVHQIITACIIVHLAELAVLKSDSSAVPRTPQNMTEQRSFRHHHQCSNSASCANACTSYATFFKCLIDPLQSGYESWRHPNYQLGKSTFMFVYVGIDPQVVLDIQELSSQVLVRFNISLTLVFGVINDWLLLVLITNNKLSTSTSRKRRKFSQTSWIYKSFRHTVCKPRSYAQFKLHARSTRRSKTSQKVSQSCA